jgi:hypothetical protein
MAAVSSRWAFLLHEEMAKMEMMMAPINSRDGFMSLEVMSVRRN